LLFFAQNAVELPPAEAAGGEAAAETSSGLSMESVIAWLSEHGWNVLGALLILLAAWIVGGWIRRAVRKGAERARLDQTLSRFLGNLAKWALLSLAILTCLEMLGVKTTSFAAVLAAVGFAIGFALNGTLGDLAAGVMLLVFRPFDVGDVVKTAGESGVVDEIELFFTLLDTVDGRRVVIPNSKVFGSPIENVTHHPRRRVDVNVRVEHGAELQRTREVLERVARSVKQGLKDPAPAVALTELGETGMRWTVMVWTQQADFAAATDATIAAVKQSLRDAGIALASPRMDVRVDQRSADGGG
jgi:small conductance mechanosensitive channel